MCCATPHQASWMSFSIILLHPGLFMLYLQRSRIRKHLVSAEVYLPTSAVAEPARLQAFSSGGRHGLRPAIATAYFCGSFTS